MSGRSVAGLCEAGDSPMLSRIASFSISFSETSFGSSINPVARRVTRAGKHSCQQANAACLDLSGTVRPMGKLVWNTSSMGRVKQPKVVNCVAHRAPRSNYDRGEQSYAFQYALVVAICVAAQACQMLRRC
jgi:hypothetical protein